jgi:hypothetical protein
MAQSCQLRAWQRRYDSSCHYFQYGATYALHDPTHYHPLFPLYEQGVFPERPTWNFTNCAQEEREEPPAIYTSQWLAQNALLAAMAGDHDAYDAQARIFDGWPSLYASLQRRGDVISNAESDSYGIESDAQHVLRQALAVAAAAAFHIGDRPRFERFTALADAHSRAVFREFMQLESGELAMPPLTRVPSEYTAVDIDLFTLRSEHPDRLFREMPAGYRLPMRLAALVGSKPALRTALAEELGNGFWAMPRNGSSLETLFALFARRKAAELAHEDALAESLRVAGQKHYRAFWESKSRVVAFAFESIVIKP